MRFLWAIALVLCACSTASGPEDSGGLDARTAVDSGQAADAGAIEVDAAPGVDAEPSPDAMTVDAGAAADAMSLDVGGGTGDAAAPEAGTLVVVAVGYGNRRTSTFDGRQWGDDQVVDPSGGDDNNLLRGVGYAGGRFVAVGGGGQGQSWTSDDGRTWSNHVTALRAFLSDAVYGNGVWVAAGGNGLRLVSTDQAQSWHGDPGYYSGHFRGIAFGNGVFVAAGHRYGASNDGLTAVSADGLSWQLREHNGLAGLSAITFGNGVFVALSLGGRLTVSTDGQQWDEISLGSNSLNAPTVANGEILVPASDGIWHSSDGRHYQFIAGFACGSIQYAFGQYLGITWESQRWTTTSLSSPWSRSVGNDGPAFTEILSGLVAP
ncbi:MAG: hypothetical protein U1E65_03125 [Myxococcota bacterium]